MSDSTATTEIPADAGLEPGFSDGADDDRPRLSGDELISAAAKGESLRGDEQADLLSYYLTNDGLPGDDKPRPVRVTVGEGRHERTTTWQVRTIAWEEWQDAIDRTTDEQTGMRDTFATASWIVARALVDPKLGPALKVLREKAAAEPDGRRPGPGGERLDSPADAAGVLRQMFRKQSGVLFELSATVLTLSKLQTENGSVKVLDEEVEAGKL